MNLLEAFFRDNDSVLTVLLKSEGFTSDQASKFLEEAATQLLNSIQQANISQLMSDLARSDVSGLIQLIDVDTMAQAIGVDTAQVRAGLYSMQPVLAEAIAPLT